MEYKTKMQIEQMTSNEIANYLYKITQTQLCKNKKYCKMILSIFIKK